MQIYFNAHHWLARQLQQDGIAFRMEDNAVVECADWKRAQELAQSFQVSRWEKKCHELAARFCPVVEKFTHGYHWSVMQVEYALDVVFAKRERLEWAAFAFSSLLCGRAQPLIPTFSLSPYGMLLY